ncbi:hypothetical protein Taro_035584 [Colocasia esculenta]|uniref:SMP-LTD domain-containing protein n=1 Tax=Colocasia esculenta TaxID=4460 RepID=A0A843WDM5_COLES|nr:hypothetical protein [Colocasia esculenta]
MAFLFGLVVGAVIGVGLVAAFVRSENSRSRQRFELAAAISAFSKMTVEDSKKILPAEYYPSWVLNWLNLELTKIWPYVNEAASDLIRSSVEPVLEQYKSVFLDSLKFSKLTLGTIAPQFTGWFQSIGLCLPKFLTFNDFLLKSYLLITLLIG